MSACVRQKLPKSSQSRQSVSALQRGSRSHFAFAVLLRILVCSKSQVKLSQYLGLSSLATTLKPAMQRDDYRIDPGSNSSC